MARVRALAAAVIIIGLGTAVVSAAVPTFDTSRTYSQAAFEAAIRPYTQAIAANARDAEAHYWLGVAYLHGARHLRLGLTTYGGDFLARAIQALEQSASITPTVRALATLAEAYHTAGDEAKAQATADRLFALSRPAGLK